MLILARSELSVMTENVITDSVGVGMEHQRVATSDVLPDILCWPLIHGPVRKE